MFPVKSSLKLVGSVLGIATDKDSIICMDNFYNISTFSKENKVIDKALQLSKEVEPLHHFSKAVATSHTTSKIAMGFVKATKGVVVTTTPEIAPIAQLTWQKLAISKAAFSHEDDYIATGGEDGRVLVYSADNYQLALSLPPLPDYISSIAFSEDGRLIFAGCFGKSAMIFDVVKNMPIADIKTESLIEDAFFYAGDTLLFCVTKDGQTLIYDVREQKFIKESLFKGVWFTRCRKLPEEEFAIVGAKDKQLRIIDLKDNTLSDSISLEHSGITMMRLEENLLYLGYSDGTIEIADIDEAREEMMELLNNNDLKGALGLIQAKNIFLQTLKEYRTKLETLWKEMLAKAIDLLAKDQLQEATAVVEPFMLDSRKREEFDYYWQQKEAVAKFMDAIEAKNYMEAYKLVDQNAYLKETVAYAKLEETWEKSFEVSKRLLFQDPQGNLVKAQDLLRPFVTVKSKKDAAMMLLRNSDKFVQADKEYKAKNFVEYFKMCDRLPFLKETLIYRSALLIGDQIAQRVNAYENQNDYTKALEICKLLASMSPFKSLADEKARTIQIKLEFAQACKERKLADAFKMAETYFELRSMPEYKKLYDDFKRYEKIAFGFATAGNGKATLDNLKEYLYIEYWRDKIAAILKIAYLSEFMLNAPGKSGAQPDICWRETFQYYIERYGKDEEIKKLSDEIGLRDVLDSIPFDGNPKGYLTTIVADSLLCIDNQPLHQHGEENKEDGAKGK
ncbi:WD40 repeat domain-containing protein [Helicobacter sp. MIT 05-5294]|uniref:WD40 repeat domain-containing protein n=1 Tax=Helicobacter sp. MIT 05-5294 TaxID=1548150 RepID=UPI0010FD18C3|nr:WD40 repeat domain-containing protein [Helicobacter sp. MIT 05-5294]TLD87303.1 WD40 repeat domain-containing protein [Helicobacter sp. MIT 05-5294]